MKGISFKIALFAVIVLTVIRCSTEESISTNADTEEITSALDVAQTSGQLASGESFTISGSSSDSISDGPHDGHHHGPGGHHGEHGGRPGGMGILDGINLLAPTNELLAIVEAESAGDFRGFRMAKIGGATVTHYNAEGEVVTLPTPTEGGPNGCSFSGRQHPESDSLLSTIVKTEIDFGTGVTFQRDSVEITRSGKIIITRSGDVASFTETTTFENYVVNGAQISGTKIRTNTYDTTTNTGVSKTTVVDGKIIFTDGTKATWTSDKTRTSTIALDDHNRPTSGTIITEVNTSLVASDGTVVYSHKTITPETDNIACERRRAPVSGILATIYKDDTVTVDYGDGTCDNKTITITVNGVTTTKTIGG